VVRSSYGEAFLNSLPAEVRAFPSQEAMMAEIKRWFEAAH
jgi:hypothetical protein